MPLASFGTDTVTSISRRHLLPEVRDVAYGTNALFYRLNEANRRVFEGGFQIEQTYMYQKQAAGGAFRGYDLLDVTPSDDFINAAFELKQYYAPMTIDGRTMMNCNSPEALLNILTALTEKARRKLADDIGTGLYTDTVTDTNQIDGLKGTVDNGAVATTYGTLARSSFPFLSGVVDSTTATLTLAALRSIVGNVTKGGYAPTLILTRKEQYNRVWGLGIANQRFPSGPMARDEQLLSLGFTNVLFDNIPVIIDDKVFDGPNASNGSILVLNEETFNLHIYRNADFTMDDYQTPVDQQAMVSKLYWHGNLICVEPQLNAVMTNVSA